MKGFTKIMLIIAAVAIGILFIVVTSVAWFTSSPQVDANEVSLSSANTLIVAFDSNLYKSNYSYDGQDGVTQDGQNDAFVYPYGYFKVNLSNSVAERRSIVKLDYSTVEMACAICEIHDLLIEDLFQVQIACYIEESGGGYSLETQNTSAANYSVFVNVGAGNGSYRLVANDYTLDSDNYLYRNDARVQFEQGLYYFGFTYTFLPASGGGYVPATNGTHLGQVSYKKIKGSSESYVYSAGAYMQSDAGEYTKMITSYASIASVDKYRRDGDAFILDSNGTYIKVKDHEGAYLDEYVEFSKFSYVAGFPYADIRFQGASYRFSIVCSVEEV